MGDDNQKKPYHEVIYNSTVVKDKIRRGEQEKIPKIRQTSTLRCYTAAGALNQLNDLV